MRAALYGALRVLRDNFEAERDRWALWLPVAMGAGIALYFSLPREPSPLAGLGAVVCAGLLMALLRRRAGARIVTAGLLAAALGFAAAELRTATAAAPMLSGKLEAASVEGRVGEVEYLSGGRRLLLDGVAIQGLNRPPTSVRLRVATADPPLVPGDRIRVRATLGPPSRPVAPGAYDFRRDLYFDGIGGIGFVVGRIRSLPDAAGSAEESLVHAFWRRFADLRALIEGRILAVMPQPDLAGVAISYVTGSQTAVPKPALAAMRDSGLAHLLSVSGLHIGLAVGILFFLSRALLALVPPIALHWPIKKWAAALALLGAGFYALLSGASVPVVRSFVMAAVVLLAVIVDRRPISMRPVACAALMILLVRPDSMMGPSFQLSFAAIVALTAMWEEIALRRRAAAGGWRRLARGFLDMALTSLVATLATAAFGIYQFDRVTNYGVIANMLAVPITGFWVMPWLILALLLMPFGLDGLALTPAGWGIGATLWTARTVSAWPGAVALVPAMPEAGIALIALGGLWLCLWRRPWRFAGLAGIAAGFAFIPFLRAPDILVAEDAKLVAVRASDGFLKFSSMRADRFAADEWLRSDGQSERTAWNDGGDDRLACQGADCRYRLSAHEAAILQDAQGFAAACVEADLVISLIPAPGPCRAPLIDPARLAREGGHAVWFMVDGPRIESVLERQGDRPWSTASAPDDVSAAGP